MKRLFNEIQWQLDFSLIQCSGIRIAIRFAGVGLCLQYFFYYC
jgi:hypothetical protein